MRTEQKTMGFVGHRRIVGRDAHPIRVSISGCDSRERDRHSYDALGDALALIVSVGGLLLALVMQW